MNQPLLSILIPTVTGRQEELKKLLSTIESQNVDFTKVEIIVKCDNKEMTIGEKRELLYKEANGVFSWQIDDDDSIAPNALESILYVIEEYYNTDCITFREACYFDGVYKSCNHGLFYRDWQDNFDGYDFVRTPFYKDVIRTSIARQVPFDYIRYGEDHAWSRKLKPLLKNEIHIDQELYIYQYNSKPEETHQQRYGIR